MPPTAVPLLSWPDGNLTRVTLDDVRSVTAPEGESKFCYLSMKTRPAFCPPNVGYSIRVAGSADAVREHLKGCGAKL